MTYTQHLSHSDKALAQQTLSLAAVFQAGWVVQELAQTQYMAQRRGRAPH